MDNPKTTPKDFFMWAGAMVAFYWSVIAFIFLIIDYINYSFPNALSYYPENPYQSGISYEMASIIILLPLFMFLMRLIRREAATDPSRNEIWVRRWALLMTLFFAGAAMAGDLIVLLTTFLNGEEMTTAFLLKVLIILLVAAGVFMHFIAELRGYWSMYPKRRLMVSIAVGVLAVASIVAGFFIVGTPWQARLSRFDTQKVSNLQSIQWLVIDYWRAKQKLPVNLDELKVADTYYESVPPTDPQTNEAYVYQATGPLSFKICANFNAESRPQVQNAYLSEPYPTKAVGGKADTWEHGSGEVCFNRTIDPSFYPPFNKIQ